MKEQFFLNKIDKYKEVTRVHVDIYTEVKFVGGVCILSIIKDCISNTLKG